MYVASRFPRYISCYIAECRLRIGRWVYTQFRTVYSYVIEIKMKCECSVEMWWLCWVVIAQLSCGGYVEKMWLSWDKVTHLRWGGSVEIMWLSWDKVTHLRWGGSVDIRWLSCDVVALLRSDSSVDKRRLTWDKVALLIYGGSWVSAPKSMPVGSNFHCRLRDIVRQQGSLRYTVTNFWSCRVEFLPEVKKNCCYYKCCCYTP